MACECAFLQAVFPISSSAALRKQQEGELGLPLTFVPFA